VFAGSVSDDGRPFETGAGPLAWSDVDLVVFTPDSGARDPDAGSALSLLKVRGMLRADPGKFRPSFRIVAEIHDPDKAELLERRASSPGEGGGRCRALTVLSGEWIRNEFLAQAIFVPGIAAVYRRLLARPGERLGRLLPDPPADPGAELSFDELFRTLYARDRLLLLGVEVFDRASGRATLAMNPRPGEPFHRFRLGDLVAVSVVGDLDRLPPPEGPCRECLRR
jgi:hypothetical protein